MSSAADRMAARKKKLLELHQKRTEAGRLNHREVVEEDRRKKEPRNAEARKRRAEYLLAEEELKRKCDEEGEDFDRKKMLDVGADQAEALHKRRRNRMNPDEGFSSFEAATARKYGNLVKQIKPDMARYEEAKEKAGESAFYASAGSLVHGSHKDRKEAIDRMAEDVNQQVDKRNKFSRRRMFDEDADVDYINERNMKFNKKLERFYGDYTKDIKDNLERGTAV